MIRTPILLLALVHVASSGTSTGGIRPQVLPAPGLTLSVAPGGNDSHDGSADRPFATLERARDHIRALKKAGPLPVGGVVVEAS